jgi:symplekin
MAELSSELVINQLNQARDLARSNTDTYPQVFKQILQFLPNPDPAIEAWCITFLHESFVGNTVVANSHRIDLAIDSLDSLIHLANVKDIYNLKLVIDIVVVVYKIVFRYVAENDGSNHVWSKLTELKNGLVNKFQTNFPLPNSDNEEHDLLRNIYTKVELIKFIIVVIDYQSKSTNRPDDDNDNVVPFNLSMVNQNHSLIKYSNMEYESVSLLDLILKTFQSDILIPQLFSATIFNCVIIMKRKPQFANKVLSLLEAYDTDKKLQSNYQSIDQYKLAKKYIDRQLKIFINHCLRNNLIPSSYQQSFTTKLNLLVDRGNEVRKKNIFTIADTSVKKRKFEGFYNPSKKLKVVDYKNLYTLNEVSNKLNEFDLSTVPQHILSSMVYNALQKASISKLTKALEIISERYINVIKATPESELNKPNPSNANNGINQNNIVKDEFRAKDEEDDDDKGDYNPESVYTLPPPESLSWKEKREHTQIIIKNFFKLASIPNSVEPPHEENEANEELTKVAIKYWKKDSWLVLLTRLATRGMKTTDADPDSAKNAELSDMIRNAIFDYFLDNIHGRIDLIIEWLNEEWYSEQVYNEELNSQTDDTTTSSETPVPTTSTYNKWAGKVLDAMIPFLEPNDRKIFIRLISDLPYLNEDLVSRIKSLCIDPARSKIGFLSLQFLIMYRPPVKQACMNLLKELGESDQEDLKEEAKKLLAKYQPQS